MATVENTATLGYKDTGGVPMPKPYLDHKLIIKLYLSGKSYEQVAEEVGCSKAAVPSVLRQNGIEPRAGAKRGDVARMLGFEPSKDWLLGLMREAESAAEAARNVGINYNTFIDLLDKFGVDREPWRGGPGGATQRQDIPVEEAIRLSNEGWTYEQLAGKYGVSYFVISKRMLEAGYRAPKNRMRKYPENSVFASAPWRHRQLLEEMDIRQCEICGAERPLAFCHIVPKRDLGPIAKDNALVLCLNDHHKFDGHMKYPERGLLTPEEFAKIKEKVDAAFAKYGSN